MTTTTYPQLTANKPHGGFVFLAVRQLCLIWSTYRIRHIQLMDLRAWFACHEMVAKRCQLTTGQIPTYTLDELHRLVGGAGGEYLRASLRRLEALGLLSWSSANIAFATSPADLQGLMDHAEVAAMLQALPNPHRRVPVPRQTLRLIAGGCRSAVIATILGHLFRCLYYRNGQCHSGGLCKATWIADVFGLHVRNIKAARKHLVTIGWLQQHPTPQRVLNRWGVSVVVNLTWDRTTVNAAGHAPREATTSHPRCPPSPHQKALPHTRAPVGRPMQPYETPYTPTPCTSVRPQEDHCPSARMPATLPPEPSSALDAAYAILPEDEKVDLRVVATAHLLQQGYKREFLIEPVIMSAVHTLLAARHTTQPIEAGNTRIQVLPTRRSLGELPPPSAFFTGQLPPLSQNKEPFQDSKNQKPGSARPAGVSAAAEATSTNLRQPFSLPQHAPPPHETLLHHALQKDSGIPPFSSSTQPPTRKYLGFGGPTGIEQHNATPSPSSTLPPPTLRHIIPEDLQSTDRLLALCEEAQQQHLLGRSESDRLTFLALAEHARVVGSQNPCGLFAALVRRQHWHFVTDSDEDAAHARLKHYLYGTPIRAEPSPASASLDLSQEAAIVRYVHTQLARAGWHGDAFGLLSRDDPTWTRERWEHASAELSQAQAAWQHANTLNRIGDLTGVGDDLDSLSVYAAEEDSLA